MDAMDTDSDCSDDTSGSVSSSSTVSSNSSQLNGNLTELAKITDLTLQLPKGLCENESIFREFFSMETWKQVPDNFQAYLKNKFLPHFPENNENEQEKTLQMLFNDEISRFGKTPLSSLQKNLEEGNYRPDVLKLRQSITKSRKIEQQFNDCERVGNLAKSLMISRERLLRLAYNSTPGTEHKVERIVKSMPKLDNAVAAIRAKRRFHYELNCLTSQLGLSDCSDEEFNEYQQSVKDVKHIKNEPQAKATVNNETKIFGTMMRRNRLNGSNNVPNSSSIMFNDKFLKKIIMEHKKRKLEESDRPEFETNDVRITDVHNRAEIAGGNFRKLLLAPRVKKPCHKSISKIPKQENHLNFNKESTFTSPNTSISSQLLTTNSFNNNENQSFLEKPPIPDFSQVFISSLTSIDHSLQDINNQLSETGESEDEEVNVETINSPKQHIIMKTTNDETDGLKKKSPTSINKSTKKSVINFNGFNDESFRDSVNNSQLSQPLIQQNLHRTVEQLLPSNHDDVSLQTDNIMGQTIIQQNTSESNDLSILKSTTAVTSIKSVISPGPELMQETHACFLSLIRDIFCATQNHRMKLDELKSKITSWLANPITALNDWYNQSDNWLILIPSAIHFLSGEFLDQPDEFVPYIEFKQQLNIYQWIGAGRDTDSHLLQLCQYWLLRKNEMGNKPLQKLEIRNNSSNDSKNRLFDSDDSLSNDKPISPPPPRCPTSWTVQVANPEEINEFRAQERQRFENPHKAYTYRMYGFESVVGPVKGIYTQILALTKARGHTMLTADRPNYVTILTLVRDATARLPNGEGTRADICELLKCSQYISPQAAESVLQTIVSGALDRMHIEHDPCVRYDPKRKIWIYLHRNRTEEEFERLHQQFQGVTKNQKKPINRKLKQKIPKPSENSLLIKNNPKIVDITSTSPPTQQIGVQQQIKTTIPKALVPPQLPALSSISSNQIVQPSLMGNSSVSPVKILNQHKTVNMLKPELVPIKQKNQQQQTTVFVGKASDMDFENIDLNSEPPQFILQKPLNYQQKMTLLSTSSGKKMSPVSGANNNSSTQQVHVTTPTGIQTVQISSGSPVTATKDCVHDSQTNLPQQIFAPAQTTNLTTSSPQQILITGNKKITSCDSTTQKPVLLQNQQTGGQILTQIRSSNAGPQQGYLIPLNSDQLQVMSSISGSQAILSSNISSKIVKSNIAQAPGLTTTIGNRSTIGQQTPNVGTIGLTNKNYVRVSTTTAQAGKSLISPHVAATNINLQQQKLMGNVQGNIAFQQQSPQQQQQTKLITNATVIRPQLEKTGSITLMNTSGVRPTTLTPNQQKQILQNLITQQKHQNRDGNTVIIPSQQNQQIQTKNVIIQQSGGSIQQQGGQISKIINVSGANIQTVSGQNLITTDRSPSQNNFNPQIIQIHQPNSATGGTKIQTINANLLQNFKQQHIRLQQTQGNIQQPPLIIKQQLLQGQQLQKGITTPNTMSVSVGTSSQKTVTSLIAPSFITTNSTSLAPGSIIQTQPQQNVKQTNVVQTNPQTQQTFTKQFTVVSQPQTITRVMKSVSGGIIQQPQLITSVAGVRTPSGTPVKVLTNPSGQIISLESLLQKQNVGSGTTLRVTGSKSNQTNLIQLAGTPGSQITQYAVVSQGRNIISVAGTPQRLITTQATNSNIATSLSNSNSSSAVTGAIKSAVTATGINIQNIGGNAIGTTVQLQNSPKVISTNQLTAQQLMNAKVLGKTGTTGIRMLNASNLNIAHIRGKPVIIASKSANPQQQLGNAGINVSGNLGQIIQSSSVNNGNIVIGGQTLKVQGNVFQPSNMQIVQTPSSSHSQTVVVGNQILKVAQAPIRQQQSSSMTTSVGTNSNLTVSGSASPLTTIASTNTGPIVVNSSGLNQNVPKTVVLSSTGQTIRVQPSAQTQAAGTTGQNQQILLGTKGTPIKTTGNNQQRVVLAVQGGGQILLPPGFQGGPINLKTLQGLKVVSLAQQQQQQQQQKGGQKNNEQAQRPLFAQIFPSTSSVRTESGNSSPSSSLITTTQNSSGGS